MNMLSKRKNVWKKCTFSAWGMHEVNMGIGDDIRTPSCRLFGRHVICVGRGANMQEVIEASIDMSSFSQEQISSWIIGNLIWSLCKLLFSIYGGLQWRFVL